MTAPPPPADRALRSPPAWALLLSVLALALASDLGAKAWAFRTVAGRPVPLDREMLLADRTLNPIPPHDGVTAIPGRVLDFRLVVNRGAVFGIGAHKRGFFIAFSLVAVGIALYFFALRTTPRQRLTHVALALLLAGALGNLYDRIRFGVVRDFLHLLPDRHLPFGWTWPGGATELYPWIFNLADVMLIVGLLVLVLLLSRQEQAASAETPSA